MRIRWILSVFVILIVSKASAEAQFDYQLCGSWRGTLEETKNECAFEDSPAQQLAQFVLTGCAPYGVFVHDEMGVGYRGSFGARRMIAKSRQGKLFVKDFGDCRVTYFFEMRNVKRRQIAQATRTVRVECPDVNYVCETSHAGRIKRR